MVSENGNAQDRLNRDFGLRCFHLLLVKSVWIRVNRETQSSEESTLSVEQLSAEDHSDEELSSDYVSQHSRIQMNFPSRIVMASDI